MSTPPPFMHAIIQGLTHFEVTRYAQMASTCIIFYDHLLTFEGEVELIWKAHWSMGKVLFLLNRYYPAASVVFNNYGLFSPTLTPSFCTRFFQWQGWTGLIACMLAEVILQMRLYAMYSLNKAVLALMVVSFVASTVTSGWIMHTILGKITATTVNIPNGKFCMPIGISDHFYTFWIPMLAFEFLLCVLALIRGFQAFISDGSLFRRGRDLVRVLLRDSVLYFLVIGATYMTCLLVWIAGPTSLLEVPIGFSVAMSCVLANRLILNVREMNRNLERPQLPIQQQEKIPGITDSDFMDYYYSGHAGTLSFGNQGSLTQFEMVNSSQMVDRPPPPEPPQSDTRSSSDLGEYVVPFRVL